MKSRTMYREDFTEFLETEYKELSNRCTFTTGWKWMYGIAVDTVNIFVEENEIGKDYIYDKNNKFIENHYKQKEIGEWLSIFSSKIKKVLEKNKIDLGGYSISIENDCYAFGLGGNIDQIKKIAKVIEEDLKMATSIRKMSKGSYTIYINTIENMRDIKINELIVN
jgi:hypothetical protein